MSEYLNLRRMEYIVTYRCTSSCAHCCNGGKGTEDPAHIDEKAAVDVLRALAETYDLESVMTFGGEPMLYPEIVFAIHDAAASLGIAKRQIITNGKWGYDKSETKTIAEQLFDHGVNQVSLSVDAFHQEYITLETVRYTAEALLEVGIHDISWNPCWLESIDAQNAYNEKTRIHLERLNDLPIRLGDGNTVEPAGNAINRLAQYFEKLESFDISSCDEMPYTGRADAVTALCMEPNGNIPICASMMLGNVYENRIEELLKRYDPHADQKMRIILEKGLSVFMERWKKRHERERSIKYYTVCEMCSDIAVD
jgi:hypothetical protein